MRRFVLAGGVLTFAIGIATVQLVASDRAAAPAATVPTFAKDIAPVLYSSCTS
jgi:hypothetical protein